MIDGRRMFLTNQQPSYLVKQSIGHVRIHSMKGITKLIGDFLNGFLLR